MKLKIEITMNNAAFDDCNGVETARILRELANDVDAMAFDIGYSKGLYDENGNRVGIATVTK